MNTHIKLSVCAVVVREGRFLVVKRSPTDDFLPNCWEFVGGGVEEKETVKNALIREIKEEVGLDISDKNTKALIFCCFAKTQNINADFCFFIQFLQM